MRHPRVRPFPLALVSMAALAAALSAQGTPVGFEETWALAPDRAAVVATLIQGSPEWHYWHCRERLDARDFATVRRLLPQWQARHGESQEWREIRDRELLLSYGDDPQRTFDALRRRFERAGFRFDAEPTDAARQDALPTRLDPELLSPTALAKRARQLRVGTLDGFTDAALPALAASQLSDTELVSLLKRLGRADIDGLPPLVVRQLKLRDAAPFGSLPIHGELRLPQLEECARLMPELLRTEGFVTAWLTRLRPSADSNLADPAVRQAHLDELWAFAQRLPAVFQSLKAHVLYWRLQHDLTQGRLDKDRLLAYLKLPRRSSLVAPQLLKSHPRAEEHVDLRQDYPTSYEPIGDDGPLLRECFERLFAAEDAFEPYAEWLDGGWLKAVLAETKLMLGQGEAQRWYALLDDPARLERLRQRVELRFPAEQRARFGADEPVSLAVDVKNVRKLVVKVFAVDAWRYHIERQREVDATIELDGVTPSFEQAQDLDAPEIRRVRRVFDLPMLTQPGTYVVEFVGNGLSSRAVVHKGGLRAVDRLTAAGHAFTVFDETGARVRDAKAWYGGREFAADERGEILLPFTTAAGARKLVLAHGARSAIVPFSHQAESFALTAGVHVAREELVAGRTARLVVRPHLRIAGHEVSLQLLEGSAILRMTTTDIDGRTTTREIPAKTLADAREFVHEFATPERLQSLEVALRGKVKAMDGKTVDVAAAPTRFVVNAIDQEAATAAPLLLATPDGYALEVRGKDGEPKAGRAVQFRFTTRDHVDAVEAALQTDAEGRIALGALPGVESMALATSGFQGELALPRAQATWPDVVHGRVGETLRLPWQGGAAAPTRAELTLQDGRVDRFANLSVRDGFLEVQGLPAGDHELIHHGSNARVQVRISDGAAADGWIANRARILQATDPAPLQLQPLAVEGEDLVVRVRNATPDTRVHVAAARHVFGAEAFDALTAPAPRPPRIDDREVADCQFASGRSLGDELRYVMERRFQTKFVGNMLPRPGLILNPWAVETTYNAAVGFGGGAGGRYGGRGARGGGGQRDGQSARQRAGERAPAAFANLDWLALDGRLQANLTPDADGVVRVKLADLGPGGFVTALVIDGPQRAQRHLVRAEAPATARPRRLQQALDATTPRTQVRRIDFVAAGAAAELADPRGAEVAVYDTLGDALRLLASTSRDQEIATFAFLAEWPDKTDVEKRALLGEHACHELHFFLFRKDRAYFDAAVRPLLAQKLEKQFLDHWLLGDDLRQWLQPWRFARLNLIERVLLAQRLDEQGRAGVARAVRDALQLKPADVARLGELFDQALAFDEFGQSALLLGAGDDKSPAGVVRRFAEGKEGDAPRPTGGLPGAPAAAAPAPGGTMTGSDDFHLGADRKPAGPTTGGPAKQKGAAKDDAGRPDAPEEKAEAESAFDSNAWNGALGGGGGGVSGELSEELKRRAAGKTQQFFRAVEPTQRLVESNWWRRKLGDTGPDSVAPNRFWAELAEAKPGEPFVSTAIVETAGSCMETLMALGAIDLPFTAGAHEMVPGRLTARSPLLLVRKEVAAAAAPAADAAPLLIGQNYYRADERYRMVDGERRDAFVTDEFLVDVVYGCQVVVTNPTSSQRVVDLLLQIPQGALPVQKGFWTRGMPVRLDPYATTTVDYAFYFPAAGPFPHFAAHASQRDKQGVDRHVAKAEARTLNVVATPSKVDTASWEHVSQRGGAAEVLAFLARENVLSLDLSRIAWRMKDKAFFGQALAGLRARHVFLDQLWAYGLVHGDEQAVRELLQRKATGLLDVGTTIDSPLLRLDPVADHAMEQTEFAPLVLARAHRLGGRNVIGNPALAARHQQLMDWLGYQPKLGAEHWLRVCQHLALQDRVEEAIAAHKRIDGSQLGSLLQYDYLTTWLSFCTGDTARARELAQRHQDCPAPHWQQRFREALAQLDEAEGKAAGPDAAGTADPVASAPALELAAADRTLTVSYRNVARVEVRYYELDVEFAFSAQPFAAAEGTAAAYVQPTAMETKDLPAGQDELAFEMPERFRQRNVLVEARAGGLVRSRHVFANALDVRFLESMGQVVVAARDGKAPVAKAYVKVFAKLADGTVRFHKDGYTDLRGRFDYASLSDDPNARAVRYAVLVLDEQRGAVLRDIAPPAK